MISFPPVQKRPPGPEACRLMDLLAERTRHLPPTAGLDAERLRKYYDPVWERFGCEQPRAVNVQKHRFETPFGPVSGRLYRAQSKVGQPLIVYIHGGGWVMLSLDSHDGICRELAALSHAAVLSLDYPLAPENPYPTGLNAILAVIDFVRANPDRIGVDPDRMALMGDSSGANLALSAGIALAKTARTVRAIALVYGAFTPNLKTPSHECFGRGDYPLTTDEMTFFWDSYVQAGSGNNQVADLLDIEFGPMPPVLVAAAEHDCLRSDSEALVARLEAMGVPHEFLLMEDMVHGALVMFRHSAFMQAYLADMALFLKHRL